MSRLDRSGIAALDRFNNAPECRLDRRAIADVFHTLTLSDEDALLLLLDVGHELFRQPGGLPATRRRVA
ncbi:MAG: hypothetical protein NTZ81_07270 [Actinobacteria bacterium]|nr:hypothetical protein [Actinomycetota bacterium]